MKQFIVTFTIICFVSCRAQIVPVQNSINYIINDSGMPEGTYLKDVDNLFNKFIGSWVSEEDVNTKWVFTTNGNCSWYYNNELVDSFTYSISETSPQCGHQVKTGGNEDFYLKLVDQDSDEYCYEIYGVNEEILSLNFLGKADVLLFNKE